MDACVFPDSKFKKFFEVSLDLLGIASKEGYFIQINPAFSNILDYSEFEILSKRFIEFLHPDDVEATLQAMSSLDAGQPIVDFENRYRHKKGHYITLSWNAFSDLNEGLYEGDDPK